MYEADVDGYGKMNSWGSADYFCGMTVDFGDELQAVSEVFYNWLIENATQPIATITYNGSTIMNLFGGQKGTLLCAGMKMESDVVVVVAKQTENTVGLVDVRIEEV